MVVYIQNQRNDLIFRKGKVDGEEIFGPIQINT